MRPIADSSKQSDPEMFYAGSHHLNSLDQRYRAHLINSLSGYKSANLIGTTNKQGLTNLSIVSSIVHLGAQPPLMGMITRPRSVKRDTVDNIEETGFYTINHVNKYIYRQAHQTSARYSTAISEFDAVGLTPVIGELIPAPYVLEATIKIGLQLEEIKHLDINNTDFIIGRIIELLLPNHLIQSDGHIDIDGANSVAVTGLDSYHSGTQIDRLSYAKPDQNPHSLPSVPFDGR